MPMERDRYPENWNQIALAVKTDANWTCQRCGKPCFHPGEKIPELLARLPQQWIEKMLQEEGDRVTVCKPQRFRLTVAHLDQNPSNNDLANLAALCAPCHLRHDGPHRQANSQAKRERSGQLPLIGAPAIRPEPAGHGTDPTRVQRTLW